MPRIYDTRSKVSRASWPDPVFFHRKYVERDGSPNSLRASSLDSFQASLMRKNVRSAGPATRSAIGGAGRGFGESGRGWTGRGMRERVTGKGVSPHPDLMIILVQSRTNVNPRPRRVSGQRHLLFRHHAAQSVRIVRDDAVDTKIDQSAHVGAVVDSPRQDLEAECMRRRKILRVQVAPEHG